MIAGPVSHVLTFRDLAAVGLVLSTLVGKAGPLADETEYVALRVSWKGKMAEGYVCACWKWWDLCQRFSISHEYVVIINFLNNVILWGLGLSMSL